MLLLLACAASARAGEAEHVFDSVRGSVVTISTLDERNEIDGEGSGVVVAAGQVVTNCHVVQEASAIRVRAGDKEFSATWTLGDVQRDICRLEVPGLTAPAAKVRRYREVQTGEAVYAVGNPLGFGLSVSAGLVSSVREYNGEPQIYTSAPISPGSSGGGLFDGQGRLIGITTRFFGGAQNFNVALPADWIAELAVRGAAPGKASAAVAPDPDWLGQAEALRASGQSAKLAEWARRWREAYPTSVQAGGYLGLGLIQLNQLQEAKQVLLTALKQDPDSPTAISYLALARRGLGEKEAAMQDLRQAIALGPATGYFQQLLARWQWEEGAREQALISAQDAVRLAPGDENSWALLADVRLRQQQYKEAVAAFRSVLQLKPNNPVATTGLAQALAGLGENDAARQALATTATQSNDAGTWSNLGVAEEKLGHYAEAERAYRKAVELNPAMPETWKNLALVLLKSNRAQEAEDALRQALKQKPDFALAWLNLSELLYKRGDKAGAGEALEKATSANPSFAAAWHALGVLRRETGDIAGAVAALEKASQLDPSRGETWAYLGEMQLRSGHADEALKALQEAEKIDPKSELTMEALSMYYGTRGGDHARALTYAERAVAINPASPAALSSKGYTLLKLGRYAEAVPAFETAIRLQPDFANAWINLGEAYLRQKQLGKAITTLEQSLKLAPSAVDARLYLASAYIGSGLNRKGQEHLETLLRQTPGLVPGWYALTTLHVMQGNKPEALAAYAKLKSLSPSGARNLREQTRARGLPATFKLPE